MTRLTRATLCALSLALFACSDVPDSPQLQPQHSATSRDMSGIARYTNGPPQITIGFAMQSIGPAGGSISLLGFRVDVPPGAVSKPTNFTIRLPVDPRQSSYVYAEFGPHGMKFNAPITLTLPYSGTTSEGNPYAHVMWFNGTQWVELETTLTPDGRIQTQTNHFSDYGTEDLTPSKGLTPVGS